MTELTLTDEELVHQMLTGNEAAFTEIYRRRQAGIYRFALQMSGSNVAAEDITQEVFMLLITKPEKFNAGHGSLSGFLYGIARNHVLRWIRKSRTRLMDTAKNKTPQIEQALISSQNPLMDLTRDETIETVRKAILILPERYREVVVLCDLHEMSYGEAASVIGCAFGTVRSRLHRARGLLLRKLTALEKTHKTAQTTTRGVPYELPTL